MAEVTALELPTFKGRPGWEFTDLSKLDLTAFAPVDGGDLEAVPEGLFAGVPEGTRLDQVDAVVSDGAAVEDGPVVLPLSVAREHHPELVEPHLGRVVASDDVFTRWNEDAWEGGAFVWIPRGVRVEAPILLTAVTAAAGTALQRRVLIVLEENAEAEVWEQYLSGDDESETLLNTVVELVVGQNARLRYVCAQDLERAVVDLRRPARRGGARRLPGLGRGRLRRRQRPRAHRDAAGRRGRPGQGHRRLRAARPPARRLRHHAGARRA